MLLATGERSKRQLKSQLDINCQWKYGEGFAAKLKLESSNQELEKQVCVVCVCGGGGREGGCECVCVYVCVCDCVTVCVCVCQCCVGGSMPLVHLAVDPYRRPQPPSRIRP